jgi:hypothetical protein
VPVHPVERKLAAIFAADIAGYSRLMARDEVRLASAKPPAIHFVAGYPASSGWVVRTGRRQ